MNENFLINGVRELLYKPMTRREFLKTALIIMFSFFGIINILKALNLDTAISSPAGYGGAKYAGRKGL